MNDKTFTDKIKAVKERIAQNGGKIEEADIHEAGEALRGELEFTRASRKQAWDDAKTAYAESDIKKKIDELEKAKDEVYAKYNSAPWGDERRRLYSEWDKAKADYWAAYRTPEAELFRENIRKAQKAYTGTWEENADELKKWLETFRTCGTGGRNMNLEAYSNRGTLRGVVTKAFERYPSDWVEASLAKGKMDISKVSRGFYNGHTIAISGNSIESQISTAFHELGHRFEDVVKGISEAEKAFYARRTAGESLQWLSSGYSKSEVTRKDKFLHKYMGKDYGGRFYELVSMGFEYAYTNPTKLLADEDFAQFVYGILALY